ncbi:unnamed protein product [Symbiodinium sp. CCMP2592]|nr:unnamed protein product [Symbiodinium sp. CCMP2592]
MCMADWTASSLSGSELPWPPPSSFASSVGPWCPAPEATTTPGKAGRTLAVAPGLELELLQLARRFRLLRLVASSFLSWQKEALRKRPKRHNERRQRRCLALRCWQRRSGRRRRAIACLVRATQAPLHRALVRLQQPVLFRRGKAARAALLEIIHRRTQHCLAQCWFAKVLLRSAFVVWSPSAGMRMRRQEPEHSGEPAEVEHVLPSSPFVLSDSFDARSQAPGGNADTAFVGRHKFNALRQAETWQSSSLPHSRDAYSKQVPGPPEPAASQPRSVLLRVQQEGFLRWWRAVRMDLGREELAEQRRKAALLVLLRQRSQNMIAFRHYVAVLQRKALSGFQHAADDEAMSRRRPVRRAKSRTADRASHRSQGLRGMSVAEVMRKGWRRWRFAALSGQRVVCELERPANVTLKLCRIASEIDSCRSKAQGLEPCTPLLRSSRVDEDSTIRPDTTEAAPEVPEHLRLLEQALAAFQDEQTGWLGRTSKGASPPSVLWEHAGTVLPQGAGGAGNANFSGWPADVVWSPPQPARPPRGTDVWKDSLCSTDSARAEDAPGILPDPPFLPQRTEAKESYQTLRGRIRTSRAYQKAAEGCEDRRSLLKETRNVQFEVLPKYGIEATEKGTSIMAAWISSAQNGIKDVEDKVAASMHLSRIAYASKLPLAKNKAKEAALPTPAAQAPLQTQASVTVERAPFPEKKAPAPTGQPPPAPVTQAPPKATPLGVATPPVAFGSPPWQTAVEKEERPVEKKEPPKPKPKPKEEKPPQALTVTLTRFSTWEDPTPQRFKVELMSNTKVSELRAKIAEVCELDDSETRKVKLIKRKKAGFVTAQETESVSSEVFVHQIEKWPK